MPVWYSGRLVYIATGTRSQTVNICGANNTRGTYEWRVRLRPPFVMQQAAMEQEITRRAHVPGATIKGLVRWLIDEKHGIDEAAGRQTSEWEHEDGDLIDGEDERRSVEDYNSPEFRGSNRQGVWVYKDRLIPVYIVGEDPHSYRVVPIDPVVRAKLKNNDGSKNGSRLVPREQVRDIQSVISAGGSIPPPGPAADPWVAEAREQVEHVIDRFVQTFVESPYLHRVEHSLHAGLFSVLAAHPLFSGLHPIGRGPEQTQLVHKEWPETKPRPENGNRRGNFDIVVLSPRSLEVCPGLDQFVSGRLVAPIVIEVGLNYAMRHLEQDARKLRNSGVRHGYLIHLIREVPAEPNLEETVLRLGSEPGIRTAYAQAAGVTRRYKLLEANEIVVAEIFEE